MQLNLVNLIKTKKLKAGNEVDLFYVNKKQELLF